MNHFFMRPKNKITSHQWLILIGVGLIVIVGTLARLAFLYQPVRYDEAYTLLVFAVRSPAFFLVDYHVPNNHILHTLLVYLAVHALGTGEAAFRLPAFLCSIGLIPAGYLLGNELYNRTTGLLAAALIAGSSVLIEYATNARGYTLLALLALLALWQAARLKTQPGISGWALLAVLLALGFYTIPIMLYPAGGIMGWLLISGVLGDLGPECQYPHENAPAIFTQAAPGIFGNTAPLLQADGASTDEIFKVVLGQ